MDQPDNWKMTPLDTLLCSNQLQILKSLVFFLPPSRRRQMILLVKLMELRQCLTLPLSPRPTQTAGKRAGESGQEMLEYIFPYCNREQQQVFRQFRQAFQLMNTFRQFSDSGMFDQFSEMMKNDSADPAPAYDPASSLNMETIGRMMNGGQMTDLFSSMMNPKQQELVAQYEALLDDL